MKKFIIALLLVLPLAVSAQKVGHVNSIEVAQAMPEYATAQKEVETLSKQFDDELQRKDADVKAKFEAYQKEAANLSETLKQYREQEIQKAQQELEQFYATCQQEIQKAQQTKMAAIEEKLNKAIKEVADAEGYAYILPINAIAYVGASANDITAKVKAKLGVK